MLLQNLARIVEKMFCTAWSMIVNTIIIPDLFILLNYNYLFRETNTSFTFLRHVERAPYTKVWGLLFVLFLFIVILHIIVDSLKHVEFPYVV